MLFNGKQSMDWLLSGCCASFVFLLTPAQTRKTIRNDKMATIRDQIQADWENREFVETLTSSVKKLAEFLNTFGKLSEYIWFIESND